MSPQSITSTQLARLQELQQLAVGSSNTLVDASFLHRFSSAGRGQLANLFVEQTCIPGEILFREGERGDIMYLIRAGRAVVLTGDLDSPTIIGFPGPGEIIGEMALLENQPRSATIIALEPLRLSGISRQSFEQLLENNPAIGIELMRLLSSRLRQTDRALTSVERSEQQLVTQVSDLQLEKQRLQEIQRLQQETIALIIHDLRNPLGTIAGTLDILALVLPAEVLAENRELLSLAEEAVNRMQRLVDSLLEVSRLESGEVNLALEIIDLHSLIQEVVRSVTPLNRQGPQIQTDLPAQLPEVAADRDRLERVLINLLDNALKYTPPDGAILVVARHEGNEILVSVTDTGPGIPPAERQRIFESFARISGPQDKRRGFGLGLSYCRLALQAHGGRIWVEPGEGGIGSRFIFSLPEYKP